MPENTLVKMKTGTIEDLQSKTENQPDVPLDEGSVYFAVDTENHIGEIRILEAINQYCCNSIFPINIYCSETLFNSENKIFTFPLSAEPI